MKTSSTESGIKSSREGEFFQKTLPAAIAKKFKDPVFFIGYDCHQQKLRYEDLIVQLRSDASPPYQIYLGSSISYPMSHQLLLTKSITDSDFLALRRTNARIIELNYQDTVKILKSWARKYGAYLIGSDRESLYIGFDGTKALAGFAEEAFSCCCTLSAQGMTPELIYESVNKNKHFNFLFG